MAMRCGPGPVAWVQVFTHKTLYYLGPKVEAGVFDLEDSWRECVFDRRSVGLGEFGEQFERDLNPCQLPSSFAYACEGTLEKNKKLPAD